MSLFNDISLRYKILAPALIGIVSFTAYLAINYSASQTNAAMLAGVRDANLPVLERASQDIDYLAKIKQDLVFAATAGEKSMLDEEEAIARQLRKNLEDLERLDVAHKDKVAALSDALNDYLATAVPLTKAMIGGTADMSQAQSSMERMKKDLKTVGNLLAQYRDASRAEFISAVQEVEARGKRTVIIGLIMGAVTMGLLFAMAWWISGMITADVKSVGASLKQIASGEADLTKQLHTKGKDEVGELVHWFNAFVGRLRTIITEVVSSTTHLAAAAEEMSTMVSQAREGAQLQQRETEQLAAAIHEMTTTIEGMAKNASDASEAAQAADRESANGKQVVSGTIATIDALVSEVEKTAGAIGKLEQESNNIGKVLDVIRDIADQTNLLALNAAIEAARAGEQGRGFAVVADEVRVLAQRSSQSTNEIRGIIERLQKEARDAVNVMQSSRSKAQESVVQAGGAGDALEVITGKVSGIAAMNGEIALTAQQQSCVAEEVNKNIININRIAQDTAAGASQSTGASADLTKLAVRLESLVGQFKV